MSKIVTPHACWLPEPEDHDYPAAESYLSLLVSVSNAQRIVGNLRSVAMTSFKAKDIFRASELPLLGIGNSHVEKNLHKLENGKALSPILLVRWPQLGKLIVADGYHRLVAVYRLDEDADIPCKIVTM